MIILVSQSDRRGNEKICDMKLSLSLDHIYTKLADVKRQTTIYIFAGNFHQGRHGEVLVQRAFRLDSPQDKSGVVEKRLFRVE